MGRSGGSAKKKIASKSILCKRTVSRSKDSGGLSGKIESLLQTLPAQDQKEIKKEAEATTFSFPFNEQSFFLLKLVEKGALSFADLDELRKEYLKKNKYLHLFDLSPRTFGETWGQEHLKGLSDKLKKPSKDLDSSYDGEYDLYIDKNSINEKPIKIEVKASRAVDREKTKERMAEKALSASSEADFAMNFQQLKPDHCDVFVFISVWRDKIRYWALSSDEVRKNKYYSDKQHRGGNGEGQLHFKKNNIDEFKKFEVLPKDILSGIEKASLKKSKNK